MNRQHSDSVPQNEAFARIGAFQNILVVQKHISRTASKNSPLRFASTVAIPHFPIFLLSKSICLLLKSAFPEFAVLCGTDGNKTSQYVLSLSNHLNNYIASRTTPGCWYPEKRFHSYRLPTWCSSCWSCSRRSLTFLHSLSRILKPVFIPWTNVLSFFYCGVVLQVFHLNCFYLFWLF